MKSRDLLTALAVVCLSSGLFWTPALDRLEGVSIDSLFWLRTKLLPPREVTSSPAVVIAVDEETYRRPPFRETPRVMWTKEIARVIDSTLAAGAHVIGFDVIFPASVETHVKGFDREFLSALHRGSRQGKIVLGKVQHNVKPISPHQAQSFIVGNEKNIRSINAFEDDDGIIRHLPLTFRAETKDSQERIETAMALELASRALKTKYRQRPDGALQLGGYEIPGSRNNLITLNFDTGAATIPTYSLADIYACAVKGDTAFLRKHFAEKVILLGSVLDVEDRKLTSKRFITGREGINATDRCTIPVMEGLYRTDLVRDSIPGAFIHATAVTNLLQRSALKEFDRGGYGGFTALFTLLIAGLAIILGPLRATAASVLAGILWVALAVAIFRSGAVLPLFDPLASGGITLGTLLGYRAAVSDRDKRHIRRVFSYYLPATVIERMVSEDKLPTLGGEQREVSIMFSDIAAFTTLSEGLSAAEVAAFLNDYLTEMSDIIEARGGFIEKFVVFGAPIDDSEHAIHAVEAALVSREKLANMSGAFGLPPDRRISARFGINSGELLVGNIGSHRRFNYATMGDAANLGSRLEGANKFFDTTILVGEATVALCGDAFEFRKIDQIRVVGRDTPVRVYEPLCIAGGLTDDDRELRDRYSKALATFRKGAFEDAAREFDRLAETDPPSAVMARHARNLRADPPGEDWDGVYNLESK